MGRFPDAPRQESPDPRLIDTAEHLLGGPVIPECPEGVLYFAQASWRTGDGTGVRGVKFALTLQRRRGPG